MESIDIPAVIKQGLLEKQGGGAGGHKNWKDRYFVLTDHLYYYENQAVCFGLNFPPSIKKRSDNLDKAPRLLMLLSSGLVVHTIHFAF